MPLRFYFLYFLQLRCIALWVDSSEGCLLAQRTSTKNECFWIREHASNCSQRATSVLNDPYIANNFRKNKFCLCCFIVVPKMMCFHFGQTPNCRRWTRSHLGWSTGLNHVRCGLTCLLSLVNKTAHVRLCAGAIVFRFMSPARRSRNNSEEVRAARSASPSMCNPVFNHAQKQCIVRCKGMHSCIQPWNNDS